MGGCKRGRWGSGLVRKDNFFEILSWEVEMGGEVKEGVFGEVKVNNRVRRGGIWLVMVFEKKEYGRI